MDIILKKSFQVVNAVMKTRKTKANKIINVAIIALVCYVISSLIVLQADISSYSKKLEELEQLKQQQTLQNEELAALLEEGTDEEYIIKIAREKLGLIFPEERIFYNASGE